MKKIEILIKIILAIFIIFSGIMIGRGFDEVHEMALEINTIENHLQNFTCVTINADTLENTD